MSFLDVCRTPLSMAARWSHGASDDNTRGVHCYVIQERTGRRRQVRSPLLDASTEQTEAEAAPPAIRARENPATMLHPCGWFDRPPPASCTSRSRARPFQTE